MSEIVRYTSKELEKVLEDMMSLERQVEEAMVKTHKTVIIETEIKFWFDTEEWEGMVIITDAKEGKRNNKGNIT